MILADSMLQTASITRCVSVAVTIDDHTTFDPSVQHKPRRGEPGRLFRGPHFERMLLWFGRKVFRIVDLANFGLALPARPILLVKLHEPHRPFDRLFLRFQLEHREPADDFLGLGKGFVAGGYLSSRKPDTRALRSWRQPARFEAACRI